MHLCVSCISSRCFRWLPQDHIICTHTLQISILFLVNLLNSSLSQAILCVTFVLICQNEDAMNWKKLPKGEKVLDTKFYDDIRVLEGNTHFILDAPEGKSNNIYQHLEVNMG